VDAQRNLVLIGMPGAGKSTVGVLLAKATSRAFVDTDVVIQAREGMRLGEIITGRGTEAFRAVEERHVLSLRLTGHVIATGGSVVYSERAMAHLRATGTIVFLSLPLDVLEDRLTDLTSRGVVIATGQSLAQLHTERQPLYERYADAVIDCTNLNHEEVVHTVLAALT
jgi:shikimate kinase